MLSGAFVSVPASANFEVKGAVYFVLFGSMDSSKVLGTASRPLVSSAVHLRDQMKEIGRMIVLVVCGRSVFPGSLLQCWQASTMDWFHDQAGHRCKTWESGKGYRRGHQALQFSSDI